MLSAPLLVDGVQRGRRQDQRADGLCQTVAVSPVAVSEQPISRYIRVTGSLTAEEQADVAAETPGRVTGSPVERGTRVEKGAELIRLSPVETEASLREAEANAAQIEARLGAGSERPLRHEQGAGSGRTPRRTSGWRKANSAASRRCSLSASSRSRSTTSARRRSKPRASSSSRRRTARSSSIRRCRRARARVTLAQKALADTVVRAPFTGVVAQRMVSTGDYVTKGMKVAEVVRITPLRVQLTVPEQFVKEVGVGQPVSFRWTRIRAATSRDRCGMSRRRSSRPASAHRRSGRAERQGRAEAGDVRDGAGSSRPNQDAGRARAGGGRADHRRHEPGLRRQRRPRRGAHRHDGPAGRRSWWKSRAGSKRGERVATETSQRVRQLVDGMKVRPRHAVACRTLRSHGRSSRPCSSCR